MSETIRTAWLSDVVDIIDRPETNRIVCHGKVFALVKHGHWLKNGNRYCECSECHAEGNMSGNDYYCRNCGAKMEVDEWEEPEINPCRGCIDYDGKGGCKSNGGCGSEMNEVDDGN